MKKLAAILTIFVLLLLLSPVNAQEGTPPTDPPVAESTPAAEEAPPPEEVTAEEPPVGEETSTLDEAEGASVDAAIDAPVSSEELIAAAEITLPEDFDCVIDVIVQRDDWLSILSEKFYGDVLAFPVIYVATNAKAAEDNTYTLIEDPDLIEPGWKLCLVGVTVAEDVLGFTLEAAPLADDTPQNLTGVIKVGGAHALSGPLAGQGQSIKNGIDMAVREINSSTFLGEGTIEVIWEDTAGNKDQAINAFNKLINNDEVAAIVGPTLSRSAFPTGSLAQSTGVPVIGSSNTASGITNIGNNIFKTNLSEQVIIGNTVERAKEALTLEKVAMIYDNGNAFTAANHNAFEQALLDEDIEIVSTIAFANGEIDLLAQFNELQTLTPDAIVLNALDKDAANIIVQARQLGLPEETRFIGGGSINSPVFLDSGGQAVNGTLSGAAWNLTTNSGSNRKFVNDYAAVYGSQPDQFAAQSYTAMWALATAVRDADSTDRAAIRNALNEMGLIESPLGLFTFDDNRNPNHSPVLQVADNGAFVVFQ